MVFLMKKYEKRIRNFMKIHLFVDVYKAIFVK